METKVWSACLRTERMRLASILRADQQSGFTLIEMIATLVLVGFLGLVIGLGIVTGMKGYLLAKDNAEITQQAQLALARISRELMEIKTISVTVGAPSTAIIYENTTGDHALAKVGSAIKIRNDKILPDSQMGDPLVENVTQWQLSCEKGDGSTWTTADDMSDLFVITINLTLRLPDSPTRTVSFSTEINPRNNGTYNAPHL